MAPDVWLRGPVPGIGSALMPVAHGLLQVREEVERVVREGNLDGDLLWTRPAGAGSVGWHLLHLAGSTDRLFTYARDESLTPRQREWLASERAGLSDADTEALLAEIRRVIDEGIEQLRRASPIELSEPRFVGAKKLPSTVLGLLAHAAEHAQRHSGQIVTTIKVLRGLGEGL